MQIRPTTVIPMGEGNLPDIIGGPFPDGVRMSLTSPFGQRDAFEVAPGVYTSKHHGGDDFARVGDWETGPDLVALTAGLCLFSGWTDSVGWWLRVETDDGYVWDYYHMAYRPLVSAGERVVEGQHVGQVGNTGTFTTSAHLHLQVTQSGSQIDPLPLLDKGTPDVQEADVQIEKIVNSEAIAAIKEIVQAIGMQDGEYVSKVTSGYAVPAGYTAYLVVSKDG